MSWSPSPGYATAMYEFAGGERQLKLSIGDILVVQTAKDGWYKGYKHDAPTERALFPASYVSFTPCADAAAAAAEADKIANQGPSAEIIRRRSIVAGAMPTSSANASASSNVDSSSSKASQKPEAKAASVEEDAKIKTTTASTAVAQSETKKPELVSTSKTYLAQNLDKRMSTLSTGSSMHAQFAEEAACALAETISTATSKERSEEIPQVPPPIDWNPKVLLDTRANSQSEGYILVSDATGCAPAVSTNGLCIVSHYRVIDEEFHKEADSSRDSENTSFKGDPLTQSLTVSAPTFASTSTLSLKDQNKSRSSGTKATLSSISQISSIAETSSFEDSSSNSFVTESVKEHAVNARNMSLQRLQALSQVTHPLVVASAAGVAAAVSTQKISKSESRSVVNESANDATALYNAALDQAEEGYATSPLLASPQNAGVLAATSGDSSTSFFGEQSQNMAVSSNSNASVLTLANTLTTAAANAASSTGLPMHLTDMWLVGLAPTPPPKSSTAIATPSSSPCMMVPGSKKIQLYMDVNVCIFSLTEKCELFFSLYSTAKAGFITENYVVNLPPPGVAEHTRILGRMKTIFHNLEVRDLGAGEIYLVCRIYRRGQLNYDPKAKPNDKVNNTTRRGYAVAVTPLNVSALLRNMTKSVDIAPNHFAIYKPHDEFDFPKLHEMLIKTLQQSGCVYSAPVSTVGMLGDMSTLQSNSKYNSSNTIPSSLSAEETKSAADLLLDAPTTPALAAAATLREKFCAEAPKSKGIALGLTAFFDDVEDKQQGSTQVGSELIRKKLGVMKDTPLTPRLELPTLVDPLDSRSDLYVLLMDGSFSQDKKSSARNIEVQISVRNKRYEIIENAIIRGSGDEPMTNFVSSVAYHSNTPTFNELVKIRIDPNVLLDDAHLFFDFWHVSNNANKSQCFSQAFFPLVTHSAGGVPVVIPSQVHTFGTFAPLNQTRDYIENTSMRVPRKEFLRLKTFVTSTRITQNPIMATIAKWKNIPLIDLKKSLSMFLSSNSVSLMGAGKELTSFLGEFFSHLFAILASPAHQDVHVDAHAALLHALTLLDRHPESRFVADHFIKSRFKDPNVHQKVLSVLVASLLDQLDEIVAHFTDYISAISPGNNQTSGPSVEVPSTGSSKVSLFQENLKAMQIRCHLVGSKQFDIPSDLLDGSPRTRSSAPSKVARRGSILTSSYLSGGAATASQNAAFVKALQTQVRQSLSTYIAPLSLEDDPDNSSQSMSTSESLQKSYTFLNEGGQRVGDRDVGSAILSTIAAASSLAASQAAAEEDSYPLLRLVRPLHSVLELAIASFRADSELNNGNPSVPRTTFENQLKGVCLLIQAFLSLAVPKPEDMVLSTGSAAGEAFDAEKFSYIIRAQSILMQQTLGVLSELREIFSSHEIALLISDIIRSMRCAPESSIQRLDFIRSLVDPSAIGSVVLNNATSIDGIDKLPELRGLSTSQLLICAPAIASALADHLRLGLATGSLNELYLTVAALRCIVPSIIPASPWKVCPMRSLCEALIPKFSTSQSHIAMATRALSDKSQRDKGQVIPVAIFFPVIHALVETLHALYVAPVAFVPRSSSPNAVAAAASSPYLSSIVSSSRSPASSSSFVNLTLGSTSGAQGASSTGLSLLSPSHGASVPSSTSSLSLIQTPRPGISTPGVSNTGLQSPPMLGLGSTSANASMRSGLLSSSANLLSSVTSAASNTQELTQLSAQTFPSTSALTSAQLRLFALPSEQTTSLCVIDLSIDPLYALLSLLANCDDEAFTLFVALLPRDVYNSSEDSTTIVIGSEGRSPGTVRQARRVDSVTTYADPSSPIALATILNASVPLARDAYFTLHALLELFASSLTWQLFPKSWFEPRFFHITSVIKAVYQIGAIMQASASVSSSVKTQTASSSMQSAASRRPQRTSIFAGSPSAVLKSSLGDGSGQNHGFEGVRKELLSAACLGFDSKLWAVWIKLVLELRMSDSIQSLTAPVFQSLSREYLVSTGNADSPVFKLSTSALNAQATYFYTRIVREALPPVSTQANPEIGIFETSLLQWKEALKLTQIGITEALKMNTVSVLDLPDNLGKLCRKVWYTLSDSQKVSLSEPLIEHILMILCHNAPPTNDTNVSYILNSLKQPIVPDVFAQAALASSVTSPWEGSPVLAALEMYQGIMSAEFACQRDLNEVERHTVDALYEITNLSMERGKTCIALISEAVKQRMRVEKMNPEESSAMSDYLEHMNTMYELMVSLLKMPDLPEYEDDRALVALRLIGYLERSGHRAATRKTMHTRYLQYLVNLHTKAGNNVEAGIVQLQQARLLDWSNDIVEAYDIHPEESERIRKERFIKLAIENFCKAEDWARGIDRAEYLRYYYQHVVYDYTALSGLLRDQARYFEKAMNPKLTYPAYYRVCFYGKFDVSYLTEQCEFVYKGAALEQIMEFTSRIRRRFPDAFYHMSGDRPSDDMLSKHAQIIGISKLNVCSIDQKTTVAALLEAKNTGTMPSNATFINVPNDPASAAAAAVINNENLATSGTDMPASRGLYRSRSVDASAGVDYFEQWNGVRNVGSLSSGSSVFGSKAIQPLTEMPAQLAQNAEYHTVDVFEYTRPWRRPPANGKPVNEFTDTWQIRTYVLTAESFPANRRRVPINKRVEVVTKPIENAIEALEKKTTQIAQSAASVAVLPPGPADVGPLSMQLSGSIDASVNGGPSRYIEAFLTPAFLNPENVHWDEEKSNIAASIEERKRHQAQLKRALLRQVTVLEDALEVFGSRCDVKLRGLHSHLKDNLDKMCEILSQLD